MDDPDQFAGTFELHRAQLRVVAYRMLGSLGDADDAVQETWLRVSGSDTSRVENLDRWLTTVVARVCLNMLRSRESRREEPFGLCLPDPVVSAEDSPDPEQEALWADAVGLALLVVLDALSPAERVAFVLHDMFAVPFREIAPIVGRSPAAARQLASRARRRVSASAPVPDADLARQHEIASAFFTATRDGDLDALLAILDPDVVLRSDGGQLRPRLSRVVRGARDVAEEAVRFARLCPYVRPVVVNGAAGAVAVPRGRVFSVMAFGVARCRIAAIDALVDPARLSELELTAFR